MAKDAKQPPPKRQAVLVLIHADGLTEVYGDRTIDAAVVNVPDCPGHEAMAEDVAELLLPARYRALYRADRLRATGIARKLSPSALLAARQTAVDIERLNAIGGKGRR